MTKCKYKIIIFSQVSTQALWIFPTGPGDVSLSHELTVGDPQGHLSLAVSLLASGFPSKTCCTGAPAEFADSSVSYCTYLSFPPRGLSVFGHKTDNNVGGEHIKYGLVMSPNIKLCLLSNRHTQNTNILK